MDYRAYLIPYPIESFAKPVLIESQQTFIGRGLDGGIQIADRLISRRHACIHRENKHFSIEDLGSQNGTFVNNKRIRKTPLNNHDKISIGNRTFLFLLQPEAMDDLLTEPSVEATDTIAISLEEIALSDLWAQNADTAARGFLQSAIGPSGGAPQPDQLAHTRMSLLYQLSENLRGTNKIDAIYDQGIKLIMEAIPASECVLVATKALSDDSFTVVCCKIRDPQHIDGSKIPVSRTLFNWVFSEKVTLVSQDLSADHRFQDSDSIRVHDLRSIICVPITGKTQVIGLLYAQSNNLLNPFTKDDAVFASAVANELALNIDNLQLQEKLLRNERMAAIGLTVSNLAHNIKNLMAINQGAAQLMELHIEKKNYPEIVKKWQWVQHSFSGISKLSNDMLAYVKEDALHIKPVDINKLIWQNRQSFEESLSRDRLKFEFLLTDKNPVWEMDQIQFQRALSNLVLNAVDAVREKKKGRIRISTAVRKEQFLIVSVADNGCGIDPQKKGKVLELFYSTKGTNGTGLGLPMVQKFVEKLNGKLKFQSKKDLGSIFQMIFPKQ